MKFSIFSATETGDKDVNEDYFGQLVEKDFAVFIVADGLGGHRSGDKAARFFTEGFIEQAGRFSDLIDDAPVETLRRWFNAAIEAMAEKFAGDDDGKDAHTTCTVLFCKNNLVMNLHCGDSRTYRVTPEKILWRTKDHTKLQKLLDLGRIQYEEIKDFNQYRGLIKSVTIDNRSKPEIKVYPPLKAGETFILCSDGFWGQINAGEFIQLAQADADAEALNSQMQTAYLRANGKSDNLTALVARVDAI